MAIEKWEVPRTVTEMRAFLGFTNYYSPYVPGYAQIVARLQDKLKVSKEEGKKGSKVKITWEKEDQEAFDEIKRRLVSKLLLQTVNPDKPFVLRLDASTYAVGATLEQLLSEDRMPTPEDVRMKKRSRWHFCLANSQVVNGIWCHANGKHMPSFWHCKNGRVG